MALSPGMILTLPHLSATKCLALTGVTVPTPTTGQTQTQANKTACDNSAQCKKCSSVVSTTHYTGPIQVFVHSLLFVTLYCLTVYLLSAFGGIPLPVISSKLY